MVLSLCVDLEVVPSRRGRLMYSFQEECWEEDEGEGA